LDGAASDSYLQRRAEGPRIGEGDPRIEDSVTHWQMTVEDGCLVFTMEEWDLKGGGDIVRQVFTAEGEFVESSDTSFTPGHESTQTMVRDGDMLRVTKSTVEDGEQSEVEESEEDYAPIADAIPMAWFSIAFAYHIREGNEAFQVRGFQDIIDEMNLVIVFTVEDIGTEMVDVNGAQQEAHVMMMAVSLEFDGNALGDSEDGGMTSQMLVLDDGTVVGMHMEMGGPVMSARAITAEEAEALIADGLSEDEAE